MPYEDSRLTASLDPSYGSIFDGIPCVLLLFLFLNNSVYSGIHRGGSKLAANFVSLFSFNLHNSAFSGIEIQTKSINEHLVKHYINGFHK